MTLSDVLEPDTVVQADITEEYIPTYLSGWANNYFFYNEGFRRLPLWIDDLSFGLRTDIYDQMMLDSEVKSCIGIIIGGILAGGIKILPYKEPGEQAAAIDVEIAHFCSKMFNMMETPLINSVLPDMLMAIGVGNRIGEMVFDDVVESLIPGRVVLKAIKVKARNSVAFIVDRFLNILGIAAVQTPGIMELNTENVYDPEKFTWISWQPVNSDPRGTSSLRAAYDPWWFKQSLKPEYMKYLTRFATESVIGFTPQNAAKIPQTDQNGNTVLDSSGNPVLLDPAVLMLGAIEQLKNGAGAVFPFGALIDTLKAQGNGEAFQIAFGFFDNQIAKSTLYQTLATEQAPNSSRAAAGIHQDALSIVFKIGKMVVEQMLYRILKIVVSYNYPSANTPIVNLPGIEQQDLLARGSMIAKLQQVGFLHPSQFEGLDADLQLPARSQEAITDAIAQWVYGANPSIRVDERLTDTVGGGNNSGSSSN